jgi:DNA-binding response OmpR family regulator
MTDHTILIIDYDPRSIERTRRLLHEAGFLVEVARDGLEGIATFHEVKPALVLIEAMIPKKHGFEVCHDLKGTPEGKKTPIVIMTAVYKGRKYRTQALHLHGCDEYVEKPVSDDQLLAVCRRLLEGQDAREEPVRFVEDLPAGGDVIPEGGFEVLTEEAEAEILARLDVILQEEAGTDPQSVAASTAADPTGQNGNQGGSEAEDGPSAASAS